MKFKELLVGHNFTVIDGDMDIKKKSESLTNVASMIVKWKTTIELHVWANTVSE